MIAVEQGVCLLSAWDMMEETKKVLLLAWSSFKKSLVGSYTVIHIHGFFPIVPQKSKNDNWKC